MKTATLLSKGRRPLRNTRTRTKKAARKQIRNVLVPIDFSKASLEGVEFALPLLKRFGAELHLVHVFEPDYPLGSMMTVPAMIPELEVGKRTHRQLRDVAAEYSVPLRRENIHLLIGQPFLEICDLARKLDIDIIVISTRGNTGLKHLVLGSTAERVVRYSPCPVLVVHGPALEKTARGDGKSPHLAAKLQKILVPIDFSQCSMKGLDYAKTLAQQFGSTLVLLHSVHPQYYVASDEYTRYDLPSLMAQAERTAARQMCDLIRRTDWAGVTVKTALETGHAGQQICERAKDRKTDLIVTSTHGTTGLKHILLGSTAEYVVRHAPCPVLVVPSQKRPSFSSKNKRT
jgi:nucleotide-binding universal stress UspA family protein